MSKIAAFLTTLAVCFGACAQSEPGAQQRDRARISAERTQAQERYSAEELACRGRFATTDCIAQAKTRRRAVLADLRRQEISLNDAQRLASGAQRQRANEEKAAAPRAGASNQKATARSATAVPAASHRPAQNSRPASHAPGDTAANQLRDQARQAEAKEHGAQLKKRLAEQHRPPAAPLPTPP